MYLSRLELDLTKRNTMRALASPTLFHGVVETAFPHERNALTGRNALTVQSALTPFDSADEDTQLSLFHNFSVPSASSPSSALSAYPAPERDRKLWRVDVLRGKTYLLLLSGERPDLSDAAKQFGTGARWETKDYAPFLDGIRNGEIFRFRLAANPTVSLASPKNGDGEKPRGRVYAHITTEYQRGWLLQKAERHGFHLETDAFDVTESRWRIFRKGAERKKRITLLSVTYEGVLQVTDANIFRETLTCGIGRGKAYGMGLLTVMRRNRQ